jgi:transposase
LNAVKYRDDILDPIFLPFLKQRNFDHVFQHDNARCHVARVCQNFLNQNHIRVLPWPALSPDLSPIELLWDELGRRVRHRQNLPETLQELPEVLVHEWNNIPQAFIQQLIGSMRRRYEAVVAARGGHTRYWTPQTSILHDDFCLFMICSDNDVDKFC